MQPAPVCPECEILRSRYQADLRVYIDAAKFLDSADRFDEAYDRAERARIAFEAARERLNKHRADHGV